MKPLHPHPDRLLPSNTAEREIARRLYAEVADAPVISPHGHVDAALLLDNKPFPDPATLLVTPDHYVTRILHAVGVPLASLGVGQAPDAAPAGRDVWRALCANWDHFLGTPVRFWLESELAEVFGIRSQPSTTAADSIYDELAACLASPEFLPRALFERFRIEVLATTDDPADDLSAHLALRADPTFTGRVIPTFRADRYMNPAEPGWPGRLERLATAADQDCGTYAGLLAALRRRRLAFAAAGGTATDSGVPDAGSEPLALDEAERIHRAGLAGSASEVDGNAYRRNMLYRLAEMSSDDGLVMQLHPGVIRNHHRPTFEAFGADTGHDLPDVAAFTRPLQPILRDFGTNPNFRIVLFTVDETAYSREIAPLAGFYPSVFAGAPWWFLDTPAAILRYRQAATDSAGFTKTSGFIDDTRAFCSIPARHDMSRRVDAAFLASLVGSHQLSEDDARSIAVRLVGDIPRSTFRLPPTPSAGRSTHVGSEAPEQRRNTPAR